MPIEGISNIRRYPRLAKIRLGIKKEGQKGPYPAATDYFVCPEEVKAVYGEKPKELDVMFPSEKLELIAPQWMKCYSYSQGKICQGDGKTCHRKVDTDNGDFAGKDTKNYEWVDAICDPPHCPMIGDKQCRRMMSLMFLLPRVPGLGVYQLDTSSFYSIVNINSQLAEDGFLRYFTNGRISSIPLKLSVVPQEVNPPGAGRKTVYVLNVRADLKLSEIIQLSGKSVAQVLLPTVDDAEPPADLYPEEVIQDGEGRAVDPGSVDSPQHIIPEEHYYCGTKEPPPGPPPAPNQRTQKEVTWDQLGRSEQKVGDPGATSSAAGPRSKKTKQVGINPPVPESKIQPRSEWDKVTKDLVLGYLELEGVFCRLTGKTNREMYVELGGGVRTDQTIPAWDAFLNLKEHYVPKDIPSNP